MINKKLKRRQKFRILAGFLPAGLRYLVRILRNRRRFGNAFIHEDAAVSETVEVGNEVTIHKNVVIATRGRIGESVNIQRNVLIRGGGGVDVGARTLIGPNAMIFSEDHNYQSGKIYPVEQVARGINTVDGDVGSEYIFSKVVIGEDCWLGAGSILLKGTVLGKGVVVGAGTVIAGKTIEDYSVIVGSPGRVIGKYK